MDCITIIISKDKSRNLSVITSKDLYNLIVSSTLSTPSSFKILQEKFQADENTIRWAFVNIYQTVSEIKLRDFQYRCLHFILNVKYILKKKNLIDDDLCSFCTKESETIIHLFTSCTKSKYFWKEFAFFWTCITGEIIDLNSQNIIMGIVNGEPLLNYLLILGKWYLFSSSRKCKLPNIESFSLLCRSKFQIEFEIAKKNERLDKFNSMWQRFSNYLLLCDTI